MDAPLMVGHGAWCSETSFSETDRTSTAQKVIRHILHIHNRHKYLFDCNKVSGYRYWCNVVVKYLEDFGLLPTGTSLAMEAWGDGVAEIDRRRMNVPATKGTFYED